MAEEGFKRKLAAILSADVEGYSRLMDDDEEATVRTLTTYRSAINDLVQQYRGRVVDTPGDNILAEFTSVVDAVNCAVEIQRELAERNAELPYNRKMEFRIGVNLGDVIEEERRIYGDGVNIAARVEAMAEAGGICISGRAYDQVENKLGLEYENLGEHQVKNITRPIRVFRVLSFPGAAAHRVVQGKDAVRKKWRKIALSITAVVVVVVVILGIWQFYMRRQSVEPASVEKMAFPLPDKPSIAVLPFDNLSGDPDQEYIADGITENIITTLSQSPDLLVIARNSAFTYKGKPIKVRQVSEELGVRYVLEGSVQKSGNRIRINAQLIDAIKGHHLWAERYDRDFEELFILQDEITKKIYQALQLKLIYGESTKVYETDNLEAWRYSVRGHSLFRKGKKEDYVQAKELFEQAIALDPDYVLPLELLGTIYVNEARQGWTQSPADSIRQAVELAEKALAIDKNSAGVHSLFNTIYQIQRQHDKAISEGEIAISLAPNYALAHATQGEAKRFAGRFEESIQHYENALRLQPYYPYWYLLGLCMSYYYVERYEDAVAAAKQYLENAQKKEESSGPGVFYFILALNYIPLGKEKEARAHAKAFLKLYPEYNLEYDRQFSLYKYPKHLEQQHAHLREAGFPE
jgi:TolB-like protein/class 3 adenylate cyclase/Tfp pilus assembly protein PilF